MARHTAKSHKIRKVEILVIQIEICEEDFLKTMMDYEMYKRGIDVKAFGKELLDKIVYSSKVVENENQSITVTLKGKTNNEK